jgi:uroporphyrinogen decarboxylase
MKTNPAEIHRLLATVTEFVVDWVRYQAACFPNIEGLLVLDDLIGFLGEADFDEFVVPYFRQIAAASEARIKLLHNDCYGLITARRLAAMGFNMFNFSFEHKLSEVRKAAGPEITLLGNVPPRDVLARGTAEDVRRSVATALADLADRRRLVLSAGGGTPPGVSSENIRALCQAARA